MQRRQPEAVPADQFNLQVHYLLVHLNFNSVEYFLYCTSRMRKWLKQFTDMQDRVNTLTWCIKEVKAIPMLHNGRASVRAASRSKTSWAHGWKKKGSSSAP